MPKLWKKTGDAKNNSDLVEVDLSTLTVSGPTVVYFPGGLTTDNNRDFISIDLKDIKALFQGQANPPQVYLASHPEAENRKGILSSIFRSAVHNLTLRRAPKMTPTEAMFLSRTFNYRVSLNRSSSPFASDLAKTLVMPLVRNAEGQRLPYETAQKNLHNLTFMAYCIGGLAVQEIYNASRKMMRETGYSRKETRHLLREIALVTIASYGEPRQEENRYTTISLIHQDDRFVRGKDYILHPLRSILSRPSRNLKIEQLSNSSIFISAAARGKWRDRNKETPEMIDNVRLPHWHKRASNHLFLDYVNTNDNGSLFSRIVQQALVNAVNRNGTVKPMGLLAATDALKDEARVAYERKIQKARCR